MPTPPPVLEVYYSSACAPCRLELPAVAAFARRDDVHVRIVIVGDETRGRAELAGAAPSLARAAIFRGASPRAVLLAAGDSDAILPYARALAADGTICARWRGVFTITRAASLMAACRRTFTSPASHRS